ncbi:hypothetical protein FRC00_004490 [Tulasnella sp. 408]|nr:hypothetical protein FRC00_004490 [Tulasnella sp. 408]
MISPYGLLGDPLINLDGKPKRAEEAEDFIQAVNKRAYAAGKQKDSSWIAEFAYPFFSRQALRWYEELDEETQNDWKLLKRAIFAEFSRRHPAPSTVPSAALAPARYVKLQKDPI